LEHLPFVHLMRQAHLIITDSGGIQEKAPVLAAGAVRLVGTDTHRLVAAATELLDDPAAHAAMAGAKNHQATERANILLLLVDHVSFPQVDHDVVKDKTVLDTRGA
jgi:UDP-N-acetylglucosamine 2-epimerase